jgi:glycosyltransferase involved in cell wall biosynthesis
MRIAFVHEFLLKGFASKDVIQVPSTLAESLKCRWSYITRPPSDVSQIPENGCVQFIGAQHSGTNLEHLRSGTESAVAYSKEFMLRAGWTASADADVYIAMFLNVRTLLGVLAYRLGRFVRMKPGFVYLKVDLGFTGRKKMEERLKRSLIARLMFSGIDWLFSISANVISVETEDGKQWISNIYRRSAPKVIVVRNCSAAVSRGLVSEMRRERRILAVSRLGAFEKAIDVLLPAFRIFSASNPEWHLMLVGEANDRFSELIREYSDLVRAQKIRHIGYVTDRLALTEIYRSAEIFVQPSRWEGFPTALIEAVKEGCIPICTPVFQVQEILGKYTDSLTAPVDDVKMLADIMCNQVAKMNEWSELRRYLEKRTENWNWKDQLEPVAALIRQKIGCQLERT